MRLNLKNIALPVLALFSSAVSAHTPATAGDTLVNNAAEVDNRPFLKRMFKDFPIVYTDTAYTAPDYIFVIKCTLMNHSWHLHHGSKIKPLGDSADIKDSHSDRPMVRFRKTHR